MWSCIKLSSHGSLNCFIFLNLKILASLNKVKTKVTRKWKGKDNSIHIRISTAYRQATSPRWIKVEEKDQNPCSSTSISHLFYRLYSCNTGFLFPKHCKPTMLPKALYLASVPPPMCSSSTKILQSQTLPTRAVSQRLIVALTAQP